MNFNELVEKCSSCNVAANELNPGDNIENINPECDHYGSKGVVVKIEKMPQDEAKTAGNLIVYKVTNDGENFSLDDVLKKTEIQLKKV
jgi:hypothetical protein